MSGALQIGPLLLPFPVLLVAVAIGAAVLVARVLGARAGVDAVGAVWQAVLVGFVAARLGFVVEFRAAYLAAPLDILDIRDGGWNAPAGFIGGWLFALARQRRSQLARPLSWSLATGMLVFIGGTVALTLAADTRQRLPALQFAALDGRTVQLDHLVGRPTVINLWATWCPPCVRELPVLQRAQRERPDVHVVFLNQGESAATVAAWLATRRLRLDNVLVDGKGQASAAFGQKGYPTTLFFDARGELRSIRVGELSAATLRERLERVAGPGPGAGPERR